MASTSLAQSGTAQSTLIVGESAHAEGVERMREIEEGYRARSTRLDPSEWAQRSFPRRTLDNLCRLASAIV